MRQILNKTNVRVLERVAQSNAALVFDFDGTLAPIVDDPAQANLLPQTRALLIELTRRYQCAVISGRGWEDLSTRLQGTGVEPIIGSHGADWGFVPLSASVIARRVHQWASTLRAQLGGLEGVQVEDKTYSIAVHYRRATDRAAALPRIRSAVLAIHDVLVSYGKEVLNLVPRGAPDKAVAVAKLYRLLGCEVIVYVGDDTNDEPVFAQCDGDSVIGIHVGRVPETRASYVLDDQSRIDELLRILIRLRSNRLRRALG